MGLKTFGLHVTLDGCLDHTQGIADDEVHDLWTQLISTMSTAGREAPCCAVILTVLVRSRA